MLLLYYRSISGMSIFLDLDKLIIREKIPMDMDIQDLSRILTKCELNNSIVAKSLHLKVACMV
jgi:hypothetical protein